MKRTALTAATNSRHRRMILEVEIAIPGVRSFEAINSEGVWLCSWMVPADLVTDDMIEGFWHHLQSADPIAQHSGLELVR